MGGSIEPPHETLSLMFESPPPQVQLRVLRLFRPFHRTSFFLLSPFPFSLHRTNPFSAVLHQRAPTSTKEIMSSNHFANGSNQNCGKKGGGHVCCRGCSLG